MVSFSKINRKFTIEGFYTAFSFNWDQHFIFNGESHNFWEAVFVNSGEVEVTEDEKIYHLKSGDIIFHAPMEFHRIKSTAGSSPSGFILSFDASGSLPERISGGVFVLDRASSERYTIICEKAKDFISSNGDDIYLGQELGDLLASFIMQVSRENANERLSSVQSAVEYRRIVSYMSHKADQNITLSHIAKDNNVSISYLKLLFKSYAGISPKSYFNSLRIRRATELLLSGMSVSQTAYTMNFSSPAYFSEFYKKHTGSTPSSIVGT